jgi:hypothetical protein
MGLDIFFTEEIPNLGEYLCCVGTALVFGVITLAAGIRRAFGG